MGRAQEEEKNWQARTAGLKGPVDINLCSSRCHNQSPFLFFNKDKS
jgi:hypothetical protein